MMFKIEEYPIISNWKLNYSNRSYLVTSTKSTKIGDIEIKPKSYLMMKVDAELLEKYQNFKARDDDVWIVTSGKCGTTWMQELCWLIVNNYDFNAAKKTDLELRSPFFEYNTYVPAYLLDTLDLLEKSTTQRVIKTHFTIEFMPKETWTTNSKIIHLIRDPRDAAISDYHMLIGQGIFEGTIEEYLKMYPKCLPNYWDHTLQFWNLKNYLNYLFITYEDMKKDLSLVIKKVCDFLEKTITEEQMEKMLHHLSFENMKNNKTLNHNIENGHIASFVNKKKTDDFKFLRTGQVGSHKSEFPVECKKLFNEWTQNYLKDSDLKIYLEN